jgi:hypothetical protein
LSSCAGLREPRTSSHDKVIAPWGALTSYVRACTICSESRTSRHLKSLSQEDTASENPPLPDRMGAICSLPRCLFFSFGLEPDAVHNCPYSNKNLIRYAPDPSYPFVPFFYFLFNSHWPSRTFPTCLARASHSFPQLTSYSFLLLCTRANLR